MAGCAPGGLAGHLRWEAKGFDAIDHRLFGEAAQLLESVPEGRRIVGSLRDKHITFRKETIGSQHSAFDLGKVGRTEPQSTLLGLFTYARIAIDLYKIRRYVPERERSRVLSWAVYHELRHTEAKLKVGGGRGIAIDRNLDFYLYPSADENERAYVEQAKIPFGADPNGRAVLRLRGD